MLIKTNSTTSLLHVGFLDRRCNILYNVRVLSCFSKIYNVAALLESLFAVHGGM